LAKLALSINPNQQAFLVKRDRASSISIHQRSSAFICGKKKPDAAPRLAEGIRFYVQGKRDRAN
jgi:hypothetical protein